MLMPMGGGAFEQAVENFRVELGQLRSTAGELEGEVQALVGAAEGLAGNPEFGDDRIAGVSLLAPFHRMILPEWQQFVSDLQGGIVTGEKALQDIANRYEGTDLDNEQTIKRAGQDVLDDHGIEHDGTGDEAAGNAMSNQLGSDG